MKAKRKRHQPEFKARVALGALKGLKTIQQIIKQCQVHPVQVSEWKKIMIEGAPTALRSVGRSDFRYGCQNPPFPQQLKP